ncbi:MAG: AMP-binding protein [Bacteroidetes bacterium]|nr:AMP-binding protein [Bacteroidota bacterium]
MSYEYLYRRSITNREDFWSEQAKNLAWYKFPTTILSQDENNHYRWFKGGMMNTSYLCLDAHIENGRGDQLALIYDSPSVGTVRKYTYTELRDRVARFAGGLQTLGIGKGDRVVIYMPMIPEAVVAMLACARLGAIHSVVFGGFAPHELAMRIDDSNPKAIISASYGIEFDRVIPYKEMIDQAIVEAKFKPDFRIFFQRKENYDQLNGVNEFDFSKLELSEPVPPVPVEATDPLYILYTSGTTGTPKGIVRDNGGHAVALKFSMENIYNVKPGEVFWAASDVGWVVGHSYIVYGPLMHGCTTVMYEGKPIRTPDAGAFWRVISDHKVSIMFTAPTAIRAIRKEDPEGKLFEKYDTTSLQHFFLAGERCDPATYSWLHQLIDRPVIDHWWQTESGWPMLGIMMGVEKLPVKIGSAGLPVCGFDIHILDEAGHEVERGAEGFVAVKLPLPPGCLPNLWNNEVRFFKGYLEHFPGFYQTGDGGYQDEEGYFYIMGRVDDVINVSGHRLSTGEMEELVASHPAVAECAVVGIADELRGQRPVALFVLKDGRPDDEFAVEDQLVHLIREKIGAVAFFKNAILVKRLPKTRSGKILRKTIRNIADGNPFAIPSTIDDPLIIEEIRSSFKQRGVGVAFD